MTNRSIQINTTLSDYLLQIGVTEPPILRALREATARHRLAKMQIAPEQGQLLGWLAHLTNARRYLEVGTFTGYSALAVALAMPEESEVLTCDVSECFTTIAREYWARAQMDHRIRLVLQPAKLTLHALLNEGRANHFDMAFIDADKPNMPDYYETCLRLVRPGGIIAIDNVFLGGRVVAPTASDPPGVHTMHAFNAYLRTDSRIRLCVLPIGDGMTLLHRVI